MCSHSFVGIFLHKEITTINSIDYQKLCLVPFRRKLARLHHKGYNKHLGMDYHTISGLIVFQEKFGKGTFGHVMAGVGGTEVFEIGIRKIFPSILENMRKNH